MTKKLPTSAMHWKKFNKAFKLLNLVCCGDYCLNITGLGCQALMSSVRVLKLAGWVGGDYSEPALEPCWRVHGVLGAKFTLRSWTQHYVLWSWNIYSNIYVLWINIETLRLEEGENFRTQPEDEWPKAVQAEIIMIILSFSSFKQTYYNLQ